MEISSRLGLENNRISRISPGLGLVKTMGVKTVPEPAISLYLYSPYDVLSKKRIIHTKKMFYKHQILLQFQKRPQNRYISVKIVKWVHFSKKI